MIKLVFGTGNPNKLKELKAIIPKDIQLYSMQEFGIDRDLPESRDTIPANAIQKAESLFEELGLNVFAEDTARYAGPEKNAEANMDLLLEHLKDNERRSAQFRTVIAMIWDGETFTFEGIVRGEIARNKQGAGGFGYDPIFIPDGYNQTFAQLSADIKNEISHRGRAVQNMLSFLEEQT
jgi:XTP/dITP diphosphohydrolase